MFWCTWVHAQAVVKFNAKYAHIGKSPLAAAVGLIYVRVQRSRARVCL